MAKSKNAVLVALDITRQLFTWDSKLHKDAFKRHLNKFIDQNRLKNDEKEEVLLLIENILYAVNDRNAYIEQLDDDGDVLERIYNVKTLKNGFTVSPRREVAQLEPQETEISKELLQLKIRLHEEIMSVKNDIKLCKTYINQQFVEGSKKSRARRRSECIDRLATPRQIPQRLSHSGSSLSLSRSSSKDSISRDSLTLNPSSNSKVKRRGSTTSLFDEMNSSQDGVVKIMLGDAVFEQIASKKLMTQAARKMVTLCEPTYTLETGFDRLIDYIINYPCTEISTVCILIGHNNLEQRTCLPTELALNMVSYIKDLLTRITGHIYVYSLLPKLNDATLDRKTSHFNSQLAVALFQGQLPRVTLMQNVIPREIKCFQNDGVHLAGPGLNKLMRAVRKNLMEKP